MTLTLDCYSYGDFAVPLVPGSRDCALFERNRHAEKCLPLSIANTAGWSLLCPDGITITWNGGPSDTDLVVEFDHPERWAPTPDRPHAKPFAKSHFKTGVVTFDVGWLFRTSPGWQILAKGPPNSLKDGIVPLEGIIETEWLDYSFTMNWAMTRPGVIRFEKDEPFCFITPIQLQPFIDCQPVEHRLEHHPELMANVRAGGVERDEFMARMRAGDAQAIKRGWMGRYMRGEQPAGSTAPRPERHYHKIRGKPLAPAQAIFDPETGKLSRSPTTRIVRSSAEAAGLGFLVVDDMVSAETCDLLRRHYETSKLAYQTGVQDEFWDNRLLHYSTILDLDPSMASLMAQAMEKGVQRAEAFYQTPSPLFADVLHLLGWEEGRFMRVHADNAYSDGAPHALAHRAYSGLLYLNDDYEGGGLYLPRQNVVLQPKKGMFVSLPCGLSHEHGVVRVERGTRYTMPFFLTLDPSKALPGLPSRHPRNALQPRSWISGSSIAALTGKLTVSSGARELQYEESEA